jgi:hypothetical protein
MSMIDLTITDEIVVSGIEESVVDDTTIPGVQLDTPREQVVETPKMDIAVTMDVASTTPPLIPEISPIIQIDTNNPNTMPTEPVTSLLDITEPTPPQVSILDIGADVIAPDQVISPIAIAVDVPTPAMRTPMSGSLGEKIGGFADELR